MTTLYIVLLLAINAFFVAAEFALVKVPGFRIDALAAEGKFLARQTQKIRANLEAYLAACQLGITMASLGLGWIGEPAVAALLEPLFAQFNLPEESLHLVSFLIGFILFSSLHIVVGEQVPKTYAIRTAEKVAMWSSVPLILFYRAAFPLNWALNKASALILRAIGVDEVSHVDVLSGSEISGLIGVSRDHGEIGAEHAEMLQNLFQFNERVVHSIMRPRSEVQLLDYHATTDDILQILMTSQYTRLPVINGSWQDLKGVVIARELLAGYINDGSIDLDKSLRPPQLVPESQAIRLLFEQMRTNREHLAFVVDEFGQVDGLVTLEDLLEEVVGDIMDESDAREEAYYIRQTDGGWLVHGLTPLHDLQSRVDLELPGSSASSLSGYLMQRLQKIPEIDDIWTEAGYTFTVTRMAGARVDEVKMEVHREAKPTNPESDKS